MSHNTGRKHEVVELLKNAKRPLSLQEIHKHFQDAAHGAIATMLYRMVKAGTIGRNSSGGHYLERGEAPREQCLLCIERGCTMDALAELWEHGYREGRGI